MITKMFITLFSIFSLYFLAGCSSSSNNSSETSKIDENKTDNNDSNITKPENNESNISTPETNITKILKSLYLSGVAFDGYIKNANIYINSYKNISTAEDGSWRTVLDENITDPEFNISASGGIDIDTGEKFEGTLISRIERSQALVFENNISETEFNNLINNYINISISPITTLAYYISVSNDINISEAKKIVARQLSISEDQVDSDYIAELKNENNKSSDELNRSLSLYLYALQIQKTAEILAKAVSEENINLEDNSSSVPFNFAIDTLYSSLATAIAEQNDSNKSSDFSQVLDSAMILIPEIGANDINKSKNQNSKNQMDIFVSTLIKLRSALNSNIKIIFLIRNIRTVDISNIAKATELATSKIESKLSNFKDKNESEIEALGKEADNISKALFIIGGLDTLANEISKTLKKDGNLTLSDFKNVLSDEVVDANAKIFNILSELNISINSILSAFRDYYDSNDTNRSIVNLILKYEPNNIDLNNSLKELEVNLTKSITNAENLLNNEIDNIAEQNNSSGGNNSVENNEMNSTENNNITIESPKFIFYLNKWWPIAKYNALMTILQNEKERSPFSAPSEANTNSDLAPTTPTETNKDLAIGENNFSDINETEKLIRDFKNLSLDLEWLNSLIFNQDFGSTQLLLALIMDFAKQDTNLSILKNLIFSQLDFANSTNIAKLKSLIYNLDISQQDSNLSELRDLIFSLDFSNVTTQEKLKDLLLLLISQNKMKT